MVKVAGPLFSNKASGLVGPRLIFSQRKSGQQVRFQKAQTDEITKHRIWHRRNYTYSVAWWKELTKNEQAEFVTAATK